MEPQEKTGLTWLKSGDTVKVGVVLDVYSAIKSPVHLLPRLAWV